MRIACLYFPTSSVGGIATNVATLRAEAQRRGDTFHVLVCANQPTKSYKTHPTKLIRGGDTFITVDGEASHHPSRSKYVAEKINANYDLVYLAFLCPHPTKAYGTEPVFLELLDRLELPIVGRISDGYFETYADWGHDTANHCQRIIVVNRQYVPEDFTTIHPNLPITVARPFDPVGPGYQENEQRRTSWRSLVWISQWKAIKGIHRFLAMLPQIGGDQDLFSNGILYYQLRTSPEWKAAIGPDLFKPEFSGDGKARFHGWCAMPVIRTALQAAWFMPEFQGLGRPSYAAYRNGSLNYTIVESLYYGATPVIPQMTIEGCGIPPEAAIGVRDYSDIIPALNGPRASRPDLGRDWVVENFAVQKVYDKFFGGLV